MSERKLAGWAASSASPEEVSTRIKGIIIGLSSVIIFFAAQFFNINLTANDVVDIATQLGLVAGAITTLYGAGLMLIRKFASQ